MATPRHISRTGRGNAAAPLAVTAPVLLTISLPLLLAALLILRLSGPWAH
ncbi:MAG TPA: hypothetical protein VFO41_08145 [Alphaproteobacteria bacterium]|nr:hypothetical protein [Alphaproteobacteria bacterium]